MSPRAVFNKLAPILALLLAACGSSASNPAPSSGGDSAGGTGGSGGSGGDAGGSAAPPFEAPEETWTYIPVEGAQCGNGGPYGVAVNLTKKSDRVLIFLNGGGACWDGFTCFTLDSAANIETGVTESLVLAEASPSTAFVLGRDAAENPWKDASLIYLPYCTGDLHAGRRVASYMHDGGTRQVHHVGAQNMDLVLARLAATFPKPGRVTIAGSSAGGYGATLNGSRVVGAFPGVRVDVLADAAPPVDVNADRFPLWRKEWAMELPPGCAACAEGLSALLPHYAKTMPKEYRFGLLAYRHDAVISIYFGQEASALASAIDALRVGTATTSSQRSFLLEGDKHTLLQTPDLTSPSGVSIRAWVNRFGTDAPAWADEGP